MAVFYNAYVETMNHEGVYSNDTDDFGGETYKGISRTFNPSWAGWIIIDLKKGYIDFPNNIESNELEPYVKEFYKLKYWDKLNLDNMKYQEVAEELFDTAVNMGVERSAKFFQETINLLNRNEKNYSDISVDGELGRMSFNAFNLIQEKDISTFLKIINVLQGSHYINQMRKNKSQEKFARGWFNRVEFIKV